MNSTTKKPPPQCGEAWIVQAKSRCLDCGSPWMEAASGVLCSGGCGRLQTKRLSEFERMLNHANLAGVPLFRRLPKAKKWVIDREGGPRYFVHLSLGYRDVGKKPLKGSGSYRSGLEIEDYEARMIVVVPEELFWEEVDAGVRKVSDIARPPSFPEIPRKSFLPGRILDLTDQFERKKSSY